jgi:hypothetical protein
MLSAFRKATFPRSDIAGAMRMSTAEVPAVVSQHYLAADRFLFCPASAQVCITYTWRKYFPGAQNKNT